MAQGVPAAFPSSLAWAEAFITSSDLMVLMSNRQGTVWARPALATQASRREVISLRAAFAFFCQA